MVLDVRSGDWNLVRQLRQPGFGHVNSAGQDPVAVAYQFVTALNIKRRRPSLGRLPWPRSYTDYTPPLALCSVTRPVASTVAGQPLPAPRQSAHPGGGPIAEHRQLLAFHCGMAIALGYGAICPRSSA